MKSEYLFKLKLKSLGLDFRHRLIQEEVAGKGELANSRKKVLQAERIAQRRPGGAREQVGI